MVSQLIVEIEQKTSEEASNEELSLALSEDDTLPDPAQPVKDNKKAVPAQNRKRINVHQEESRSKRLRKIPARLLD